MIVIHLMGLLTHQSYSSLLARDFCVGVGSVTNEPSGSVMAVAWVIVAQNKALACILVFEPSICNLPSSDAALSSKLLRLGPFARCWVIS